VRFASVALVKQALGQGPGLAPPRAAGAARLGHRGADVRGVAAVGVIKLPSQQETIILAMDVSGSMRATDIKPSRIVASQEAAKKFVNDLPHSVACGRVSFAGTAAVVAGAHAQREDVIAAIDRFQAAARHRHRLGIVLSLATLFPTRATTCRRSPAPSRCRRVSATRRTTSRVQAGRAGVVRVGGPSSC